LKGNNGIRNCVRGLYNRIIELENCVTEVKREKKNKKLNKRMHKGTVKSEKWITEFGRE